MIEEVIQTIKFPEGINVTVDGSKVTIKAEGKESTRDFKSHRINFEAKDNSIVVIGSPINKQTRALMHTIVAHIKNMGKGLKFGYQYDLKVTYSHFPMTASVEGNEVVIKNFLGEKFPRRATIVGNAKVEIKGQDITVTGNEIEEAGQTAANITQTAKVRGRDIRRFTDGIYLAQKTSITEIPAEFEIITIRGRE